MEYAIQLKNVTKTFGKVVANKNVNLDVKKGEILSLLGENGSGKTTLMNMISGIYFPDSGEIMIDGRKVEIRSPKDAYDLGIGMIHQHFKLIDVFSATENIALGLDKKQKFDLKEVRKKAQAICDRYHFDLDLNQKGYNREDIKVLDNVSFDVYGGEILGIAGISGNGQKELLEAIAGLQITGQGSSIEFYERGKENQPLQLVGKTPKKIRDAGVHLAFVPEDRLGMGLVGSMGMTGNMLLKSYGKGASPLTDMRTPKKMAEKVKEELEVVTPSLNTPVSRLSGGNVQKVLVGREIAEAPTVLMTAYAVRGLDINTSYTIYNLLDEEKKEGVAVVYVGEDLDVLIDLCDRILVLCGGKENGILDARTTTKEEVGLLMTNLRKEGK